MDLGLSKLSDDQAISLLQQVLSELATRDPIVRQLAQQQIISESEKLDIAKAALAKALASAKQEYIATLENDVLTEVRKAVSTGLIRLSASEESKEILRAHHHSVKQLSEEVGMALKKNKQTYDVVLMINGGSVELKVGGLRSRVNCNVTDVEANILIGAFQQIMHRCMEKFSL